MNKYGQNAHILGRYCSLMRLKAYQALGFDDSDELNAQLGNGIIDYRLCFRKENDI